jgi:hypothetical protein
MPFRITPFAGLDLSPGIGLGAALVQGEGITSASITDVRSRRSAFLSVTEAVGARWWLNSWAFAELDLHLSEPLRRDEFTYRPAGSLGTPARIYAVPAVTGAGGLGFGIRLR